MRLLIHSLFLTSMVLAGCASQPNQSACCASFDQFPISEIGAEQKTFEISDHSPSFKFPSGVSRFVALKIPAEGPRRILQVKTYVIGAIKSTERVFAPRFMFDSNRHPVRDIPYVEAKQGTEFIGNFWSMSVPLQDKDSYVIVYTDASRLGEKVRRTYTTSHTATGGGVTVTMSGIPMEHSVPRVAEGTLRLKLE